MSGGGEFRFSSLWHCFESYGTNEAVPSHERAGTRCSPCLIAQFGLTPHAPSLLLFLLTLQSPPHQLLTSPALCRSMDSYWRWCVRDDEDREFVGRVVERVRSGGSWSEEEYREWIWRRTEEKARNSEAGTNGAKEENGNDEANSAEGKL